MGKPISVVDIVVKLWVDNGGIVVGFLAMEKIVFFFKTSRPAKGPTESLIHWALFVRGRRKKQEFDNLFNLVPKSRTSGTTCPLPHVLCGVLALIFILTSKVMVLNSTVQVCMASDMNCVNYGTGLHGQ